MSDLIERLRATNKRVRCSQELRDEAAARISALEAALNDIILAEPEGPGAQWCIERAIQALQGLEGTTLKGRCHDCHLNYADPGFADLVVSNEIWDVISPTGNRGGLLCPTCLIRALRNHGFANVIAEFHSGPAALDLRQSADRSGNG